MKVTVLVSEPLHGLFYQRLGIPFKRLEEQDPSFRFTWRSFYDPWWKLDTTSDAFVLAHPGDVEHMQIIEALKKDGKRVILDFDDLLTDLPSDHPEYLALRHCRDTVPHCLRIADDVVVTTKYLERFSRQYNKSVHIVENHYDTDIVRPERSIPKPYHTAFTVGWVGGQTHVADQWEFVPALEQFLEETPDARAHFKVLCPQRLLDRFGSRVFFDPEITHHLDYHRWLERVPWDVCLVGLQPHPFNDAKSDLRFVDMAVHGIPCIASPREDFVKHADRVVLADKTEGWLKALRGLYTHQQGLKEMSEAARQWVIANRSDFAAAEKWKAILLRTGQTDLPSGAA